MGPTVTVIIPHHNYEEYVVDAIKSALNQTYPCNICVVDDGSKRKLKARQTISDVLFDEGVEVQTTESGCMTTLKQGNRILIMLPEATGPSNARNVAIDATLGNTDIYINLDADDIMESRKVEEFVNAFVRSPNIGVVYADYYSVNTETGIQRVEYKEPYSLERLHQECIVHSGAGILKKALVDTKDQFGYYDINMRTCEDYDLWVRIAESYIINHIAKPLTTVRIQPRNSTATVDKSIWESNWQRIRQKMAARNGQK
jgi:glycosyltransferase involved in cell wall biosynthesis